jgi:Bacteriophage Mu Gam like protein
VSFPYTYKAPEWPEEPPEDVWQQDEYDPDLPHTWPTDEKVKWQITNDAQADWALAKYARAEQEIKRLNDLADEEIARIRQRVESATSTPQHDLEFFGGHLTRYHQRLLEDGQAGQTYKLLNGDLTARKLPDKVHVTDPDLIYTHDESLVRIKVEPDKRAIAAALKLSDVPGAELVPGETVFKPRPGRHEQPAFLPMPGEDAA